MTHRNSPRLIVIVLALLATLVAGSVAVPEADAAKPCWRQLINDWYDGRIDKSYPISCYRQAIKNLPPDVKTYSSAQDDLERALQNAIRRNGGRAPTVVPPSDAGRTVDPSDPDEEAAGGAGGGSGDGGGGPSSPEDDRGVLDAFEPANADSIPVPLLVLAGVAMLLLAAAATGFVAKRIQERRVPIAPTAPGPGDGPSPPRPPE